MYNTKRTLVVASVAALFTGSVFAMSDISDVNSSAGEKINGKYAANYEEIIKKADGKYLDRDVIEAILGKDAAHGRDGLVGKLDPANPYSFEVDDSIDGGNHGNSQCKVPKAFTEVHDSAAVNYFDDATFTARGFGTPIAEASLKKWNISVDGDGKGLPDPSVGMTIEEGGKIYVQFCAMCHGEFGEGAKGYLALAVEQDLVSSHVRDPAPMKSVGNYWPYASTLFDYIRRTMPFWTPNAPSIGDAGYMGMTGYILQSNYIVMDDEGTELEDDTFFNSEVLMKMNKYMPNQGSFFCDHRPVIHNDRCMTNCDDSLVGGDGLGQESTYRQARKLPDGTPQYNTPQRMHEDKPGVGHSGM
ncbi:MAG: S-disulfanyl-L-cysteine oxidoreductase SoxD [Thiomicrorhabdus sp.]|nr:MAG: S-disulfanyl-L-cysteine oxidoreductase SoxD [Thiomicrorhabdus sp.]